jgi:autoinducer 2-degrading protein
MEGTMLIVNVYVQVKEGMEDAFREASLINAQNSVQEPGIAKFDVLQQQDDPSKFLLVEVYRTLEDPARHKETEHYLRWRDTVADMMAEPRYAVKYDNIYPEDIGWG